MFSQTTIIGRMTREPELKYSSSGKAFIRFGVAVDRLSNGEKVADFFDVTAFDKSAEFIGEHGYKGCLVFVEGRMESATQEKDGKQVKYWNLIASRIIKLSWKDDNTGTPAGSGQYQQQGQRQQTAGGKQQSNRGDYDPRMDPNSPQYDPDFDPWADEDITDADKQRTQAAKQAAPAPAPAPAPAAAPKRHKEDW